MAPATSQMTTLHSQGYLTPFLGSLQELLSIFTDFVKPAQQTMKIWGFSMSGTVDLLWS